MACISSATLTAALSWAMTILIPAPCCKTWCVTLTRARVLVIGLAGCENNQVDAFRETLGEFDADRVHFMICQHQDDEVEAGIAHLHQLYNVMRNDQRAYRAS